MISSQNTLKKVSPVATAQSSAAALLSGCTASVVNFQTSDEIIIRNVFAIS